MAIKYKCDFEVIFIKLLIRMIAKVLRKSVFPGQKFSKITHNSFYGKASTSGDYWSKILKSSPTKSAPASDSFTSQDEMRAKELTLSAYFLIRYYRMRGHELAKLDPLSTCHFIQTSRTLRSSARSMLRSLSRSIWRGMEF